MSDVKLGVLLEPGAQRDAIHIAIAPVVAVETLKPGQDIGFAVEGDMESVRACKKVVQEIGNEGRRIVPHEGKAEASHGVPLGIVDPFLRGPVKAGQRFYMFLYPNTVTGLRHEWTHPAFPSAPSVPNMMDHEVWLRAYAMRMNSYDAPGKAFDDLISGLRSGELFAHGSDLHGLSDLDDADDLRMHAEAYLGIRIDWQNFEFRCSC
jgi:hypothetical protein